MHRILFRIVSFAVVATLFVGGARHTVAQPAASTPNIVFILADDMGYGDVQALNPDSKIPTPNIDRLASEGMLFVDGHSPSAVCTPTRYGVLTGRYCWRTQLKRGVLGGYSPPLLEKDRMTVASLLRGHGYRTGAVGKWHLGMDLPFRDPENANRRPWDGDPGIDFAGVIKDSPIHHGFDSYFGVSASLDMAPYVYIRNDRFTKEPSIQQPAVKFPHFVRKGPRADDFIIDEVLDKLTEEATAFIRESAKGDKPFFLYMPLTGPHKPTQPHERFRGKTGLNEYGDFIHQVDWTVGAVLESLDAADVTDKTLVVYTSDNGSYMYRYEGRERDHVDDATIHGFRPDRHRANGPLRGTKADVWEAGHRVPLVVRWPGRVAAGSRCSQPVVLTDFLATFAEITGANVPTDAGEDSISLLPLLLGADVQRAAPVVHHSVGGMFAVREGKWKLVLGDGSGGREKPSGKPFRKPFQLFDLSVDLGETKNVAAEHPAVVEYLTAKFEALRASGRSAPPR